MGTADRADRPNGQKRRRPTVRNDGFAPILASRLAALSGAGMNATQVLRTTVTGKPLPDDHAAAALWWRICRHLPPSLSTKINQNATFTSPWESKLAELVGAERAQALQASPVAGASHSS
jgi:hypothetical protein